MAACAQRQDRIDGAEWELTVGVQGLEQARPLDLISQPWIWIVSRAPALDLDCIFVRLDRILSKNQSRDWIWIGPGGQGIRFGLLLPSPALDLDRFLDPFGSAFNLLNLNQATYRPPGKLPGAGEQSIVGGIEKCRAHSHMHHFTKIPKNKDFCSRMHKL